MRGDRGAGAARHRDWAQGRVGLLFWGAPIAVILVASALPPTGWVSEAGARLLLVAGTGWLGATCLVNGIRCGRVHCLVDGTLLPALAVIGALGLLSVISIPWNAYGAALGLIVIASFCLEWFVGPYVRRAVPPS